MWIACTAALLALSACGAPAAPATTQPPTIATAAPTAGLATVRVGISGTLGEAGLDLALGEGYFKQAGLDVVTSKNDTDQLPQLLSGALDLAATPVNPGFFNAAARNVGLKIIAPMARQDPGASGLFLAVRQDLIRDGRVRAYGDLKGLRVAVPNHALEYVIASALRSAHLDMSDVDLVTMDFNSMLGALSTASIDACLMPEPLATAAAQKGLIGKWKAVGEIVPGNQQTVVVASGTFLQQHGDLARRWVTAYLRGVRDYNDAFFRNLRRPDAVAILGGLQDVKDPALYDNIAYTALDPDGTINMGSIDDQMHWFVQAGYVPTPIDVTALVDTSLVEAARASLGPYR